MISQHHFHIQQARLLLRIQVQSGLWCWCTVRYALHTYYSQKYLGGSFRQADRRNNLQCPFALQVSNKTMFSGQECKKDRQLYSMTSLWMDDCLLWCSPGQRLLAQWREGWGREIPLVEALQLPETNMGHVTGKACIGWSQLGLNVVFHSWTKASILWVLIQTPVAW